MRSTAKGSKPSKNYTDSKLIKPGNSKLSGGPRLNGKERAAYKEAVILAGFKVLTRLAKTGNVDHAINEICSLLDKGLNPDAKFQDHYRRYFSGCRTISFEATDTIFSIIAEQLIPKAERAGKNELAQKLEILGDLVFPPSLNYSARKSDPRANRSEDTDRYL